MLPLTEEEAQEMSTMELLICFHKTGDPVAAKELEQRTGVVPNPGLVATQDQE